MIPAVRGLLSLGEPRLTQPQALADRAFASELLFPAGDYC